mgnify:CR=1 FL=1
MSFLRRVFPEKANQKKCEVCALISGGILGVVGMLIFLETQTPVLASAVRGFLAGETVSKDVVVQTTKRFEEELSLMAALHYEEVTKEHMDKALHAAMAVFDPFNRPSALQSEEAMDMATAPSMGYGWTFASGESDVLKVGYVVPGGPADSAGVKMGDVIVGVGPLLNAPALVLRVALDKGLGGEENAPMSLQIDRDGDVQDFSFQKDFVKWPLARDYGIEEGVLRIAVMQFLPGVAEEIRSIVDENVARAELDGTPLEGVALDLRRNPGGLVVEANELLEDWLDEGVVGYVMKGRTIKERTFVSEKPQRWPGLKLAVLQNGYSASCSEIVSGALKETNRAKVFGWRSVGKGSVQQSHASLYEGALNVTFAHYTVGAHGTVIAGVGVAPDFEMSFEDDYDRPYPFEADPVMDAVYDWMSTAQTD